MNEDFKIKEAEYFYCKMQEEKYDKDRFEFNLSAFLSAAQSIKYYIQADVKGKEHGKKWYGDYLSTKNIFNFFGDKNGKRGINVHIEPVSSAMSVAIPMKGGEIHVGNEAIVTMVDKCGEKKEIKAKLKLIKSAVDNGLVNPIYKFDDWEGPEDIFLLCEKYLEELKKIVEDGKSRGYLIE